MHILPYTFLLATPTLSLLAFPGASGFGRNAIGGRLGTHYPVTNLNDSGPGSLRDAVSKPNRIITFTTGGLIKIKERLVVSDHISILGQTAPGDGITVYGNGWSFSSASDTIVRYIRIRMGKSGISGKDAISIASGSNMIFDHVSVSWGRDETFSISGSEASNITIQNSIIAQGLETHSCGGLVQTSLGNGISLFRNLYIDNKTRNPKVKGTNDFTNNVVYNWGGGGAYIAGDSAAVSEANIVGNYFVSGPSSGNTKPFTRGNDNFRGFVKGNFWDGDRDGKLGGGEIGTSKEENGGMNVQSVKFGFPEPGKILDAKEALMYVQKYAGASLVRDVVDKRLIEELSSFGTEGQLIADENASPMTGPGDVKSGEKRVDTDGDGIPDVDEEKLGFDKTKDDAMAKKDGSGYVNVEVWANSLVPDGA